MRKVLIYTKSLEAGTGTYVESLATLRKNPNIKLRILSSELPRVVKSFPYIWLGSVVSKDRYSLGVSLVVRLIQEICRLRREISKFSPEFILTVDTYCLLLCQLALIGKKNKPKVIATVHNNLMAVINYKIPPVLRRPIRKFIGLSLRKSDRVVTISRGLSDSLLKDFGLIWKPQVIYYGIANYRNVAKKGLSKELILLSVGRLHQQKNFSLLIEAYFLIQQKFPTAKLWVVGDGPLRLSLEQQVKDLGLKGVRFFGWQKNPKRFYRVADLFVFASNWEGFGWVILEAMNYGLPVVATDTPYGPRELLENGRYGRLCRSQKSENFAREIEVLLSNKSEYLRTSRLSIKRSRELSQEEMLKQYLSFF